MQLMRQSKVLYQSRWPLKFKSNFLILQILNMIHIPVCSEGFNISTLTLKNGSTVEFYNFNSSQWIDYLTMLTFLKLYILYP